MRDSTARIGRHVADRLQPDESVLASVALALRGTGGAQLSGAARGGVPDSAADQRLEASRAAAAKAGVTAGTQFFLLLTSARLLLIRRSAFGRPKEVVFEEAIHDLAGIRISKQGQAVIVQFADERDDLRLETPKAFKFLPPVYEQLPALLDAARSGRS